MSKITLRPYQADIIEETLAAIEFGSQNIVISSPPACIPGFTEFLTPYGWKRIDEYKDGDLVCQWKLNGETKFVKPSKYINQDCKDNFINIKTNGINITVSENHKMPYLTNRGRRFGKPSFLEAKELIKMGEIVIPRYFQTPENIDEFEIDKIISYKNLSDDILKVIIMQSADGSIITHKNSYTIGINVKKERKKERARLLLSNAKIEYTEKIKSNGYSCFYYKTEMPQKDISFLYNLPEEKLKNLAEEIVFWDGSNQNIDRSNTNAASFCGNKRDVDAAQYALSIAYGNYVSIYKDKREYKNEDIYQLRISSSNKSLITTRRNDGAKSAEISYVEPNDGKHYCFETESGFWLMRQNNQIYPTGNSGKSIIISETARLLEKKGKVVISVTISALLDQIAHHLNLVKAEYSILKAGRESEFDPTKRIQLVQAHTLHARLDKTSIECSYFLQDECFTPETEIFTENGFIRFDKLEVNTKVAQYNSDKDSISFVNPLRHIKNHTTDDLVHMYSDKGIDLVTTKNHNMLTFDKKTNISNKTHAINLEKSVNNLIKVSSLNTIVSNITDELSYDEKLALAFQADGSYNYIYSGRYKNKNNCSILFSFSKERKIKEFTNTFTEANELKSQQKIGNIKEKKRFIIEDVCKNKLSKNLRDIFDITKFSTKKAIAFLDYLMIWDGHITKTGSYYYSSKTKDNVDFVQEVCIIAGKKTKLGIQVDNRSETFSDIYRIYISHANSFTTSKIETSLIKYNGYVYCVEVPDGNIIVRRNNKIAIVGNCHREYDTDRTKAILKKLNPKAKIGYSGTCYDQAGFALEGAEVLTTSTIQDMQDAGYLCPINYYVPKWAEQVDYSQVKTSGNDYNTVELEKIINTTEHLQLAIKSMNEMDAKNKKTMVFCSSIEQADKFTNMLVKAGYEAMSYHSKSDNSEDILKAFIENKPFVKTKKKSKLDDQLTGDLFEDGFQMAISSEPEKYCKCLVSINRLGIGFDCPDVVLGVQLRKTAVRSLVVQQIMRLARKHPSKEFSEYLDLAQSTSTFGFHADHYIPPQRTGDKAVDKKAIQDLESTLALEDITVCLDLDEPSLITRDIYIQKLNNIKKSLEKDLKSMTIQELAKAYEISKDHKEIITIATLIYTWKFGKPISKNGFAYDYKPEQFWSTSTFGSNPHFHVHYDMQYYFDEFPSMKKQWIKSLKTRCRNIIKQELGLFKITGFIQFLRDKYVEENTSMLDEYRKPEPMDFPEIDIDIDEVPF